jgi:bla regulator protein blaR1
MSDAVVLVYLVCVSAATTFAVLLVALARAPLRGTLGARAAYWLWLAVPMSALALMLPHIDRSTGGAAASAPDSIGWLWARVTALSAAIHVSRSFAAAACAVWVIGVGIALALMILRQRSYVRSLGALERLPDGTWRSRAVAEPMLIGALRPRVLVPLDFERHYSGEEREFVLAHERAHLRRCDTLVNALGALWLCIFWYNPLMFWAMRLLRFDQDLACDAAVLASAGRGRRGRYAEALLKAQLAGEEALPLPLACHWGSVHPLRHRIAALRRPVPGRIRHGIGIVCAATLIATASLAARAMEPGALVAPPAVSYAKPRAAAAAAARHAVTRVCPLSLHRARERQQARAARG